MLKKLHRLAIIKLHKKFGKNKFIFYKTKKPNIYIYKLDEDFTYTPKLKPKRNIPFKCKWLEIDEKGTITVKKNYAWDGCSIKKSIFDLFIVGTPEGIIDYNTGKPKTYYASLVHDALYQFHSYHTIERKEIDLIFLEMLKNCKFRLAYLYYFVVRKLGGAFVKEKKDYVLNSHQRHLNIIY